MKVGVTTFMTDEGIRPGPLAAALEERGFDSLFVHDHSHVPVLRETPFPGPGAASCPACTTGLLIHSSR